MRSAQSLNRLHHLLRVAPIAPEGQHADGLGAVALEEGEVGAAAVRDASSDEYAAAPSYSVAR